MSHGRRDVYHIDILSNGNQKKNIKGLKSGLSAILENVDRYPLDFIVKVARNNVDPGCQDQTISLRDHAVSLAAKYDRVDVMEWLVEEMHCPVNIRPLSYHPVMTAIEEKKIDALGYLVDIHAADGLHGYCITACISSGNLEALKYLVKEKQFQFELENQSFKPTSIIKHNVTTLMMHHQQFEMIVWFVEMNPSGFINDLHSEDVDARQKFFDYLDILDIKQLEKIKSIFEGVIEIVNIDHAVKLERLLHVIEAMIEEEYRSQASSSINTPSTPGSLFALTPENGSPKKGSMLYMLYDKGYFRRGSENENIMEKSGSHLGTSPRKKSFSSSMTHFNSQELMNKLGSLSVDDERKDVTVEHKR